MADLMTIQRQFAAAVLDDQQCDRAATLFCSDDATTRRRIAIYRGNVVAAIQKTMAMIYPVTRQIVGDEFFVALVRAYWKTTPSQSGNLHDYGSTFGDFTETFQHTADMPYLADVVRLEWLVHQAYCAAQANVFDAASLATIAPDRLADVHLDLIPGTAVLVSNDPVVKIWSLHQAPENTPKTFDIDWQQRESALVFPAGAQVQVKSVGHATAKLIESLGHGLTLGEALERALAQDDDIQPEILLTELFSLSPICGFWLD